MEIAFLIGKLNKFYFYLTHFRRSSIGTFIRPNSSDGMQTKPTKAPPPKLDYRSMVSIDDMPELFVSFDSKYHFVYKYFYLF